jgi:UDP-2-acetamido-2,6-beta-L-arabino-hexul-4-ose reductase
MIEGLEVCSLEVKRDDRGWLAEVLRAANGPRSVSLRQIYITVGNAGKTKGKHYHTRKTEWFCVATGEAKLSLRDTRTGEEQSILMGESNMVTVQIPPHVAHAITNTGDTPMYLIVVVNEEFNPQDPDTFPFSFPGL